MGAEHSQQRLATDGSEFFDGFGGRASEAPAAIGGGTGSGVDGRGADGTMPRRTLLMRSQTTLSSSSISKNRSRSSAANTHGSMPSSSSGQELARGSSSPPLSICSDLPYVSYTANKPIGGDSPKMRGLRSQVSAGGGKSAGGTVSAIAQRSSLVLRRPAAALGAKPKRPQTTGGLSDIVIVKPNTQSGEEDMEPELQQLLNIPQFMPVLRDSLMSSLNFSRDSELLERFKMQPHVLNICTRLQHHFHGCANQVAQEQFRLVEKTKVISNTSTRVFASLVDMQKTYDSYAEQFAKMRLISEELDRCQQMVTANMETLEEINAFLPAELRLPAFKVWLKQQQQEQEQKAKADKDETDICDQESSLETSEADGATAMSKSSAPPFKNSTGQSNS